MRRMVFFKKRGSYGTLWLKIKVAWTSSIVVAGRERRTFVLWRIGVKTSREGPPNRHVSAEMVHYSTIGEQVVKGKFVAVDTRLQNA